MAASMPYVDLLRAAECSELNGGFMRVGDDFHVGDLVITGEDRVAFALILSRRASEREQGGTKVAFQQGFEAGKRATLEAVIRTTAAVQAPPAEAAPYPPYKS